MSRGSENIKTCLGAGLEVKKKIMEKKEKTKTNQKEIQSSINNNRATTIKSNSKSSMKYVGWQLIPLFSQSQIEQTNYILKKIDWLQLLSRFLHFWISLEFSVFIPDENFINTSPAR